MFNSVLKKLKKALGTDINSGVIQNFPDYPGMVEGGAVLQGLIYSAQFSQASTTAPALASGYTVINPHGITAAITTPNASTGVYAHTFAFAGITTLDAPALARLRVEVQNHTLDKIITNVKLTISTTTVTATLQVVALTASGAALPAAELVGDYTLKLYMV